MFRHCAVHGGTAPDKRLRPGRRPDKAGPSIFRRPRMLGIGVIVLFLVVIGALNFYEFGRLD
jgi:hypothetical protein